MEIHRAAGALQYDNHSIFLPCDEYIAICPVSSVFTARFGSRLSCLNPRP
jgi:hypothetical protein